MRVLRALFNFARGQYEDAEGHSLFPENPVSRLSHTRAWYPNQRRRTVIQLSQLPAWYAAVMALKADPSDEHATTVADYQQQRQEAEVLAGSSLAFCVIGLASATAAYSIEGWRGKRPRRAVS